MTPTLRAVVEKYNDDAKKREKTISKYENIYDATTIPKSSQKLVPDGQGKIKGINCPDGVVIDFYIEYEDVMAPGDKISYFSALKGVISDVIPTQLAPYAESEPDIKIDACLSAIGIYKRMCLDIIKVGCMNKVVIEKKRQLARKYLPLIEKELGKK